MGTIYKRGETYWIKYYNKGKPFYESAKTDKKMVAKKFLDRREGEIADGKIPGILFDKIKFDDLAEDFLSDYRVNQKKSLAKAERSVNHLKEVFGGFRAPEITTSEINKYIEFRMADKVVDEKPVKGACNATINRELAALKRMMNIGAGSTPPKVDRVPHIPMLKENNVRKGFFEHAEFLALREKLPEYLQGPATLAYKTGWRRGEIFNLTWSQVDLEQGCICLNPGETKNDQGRTIYLDKELKALFDSQWKVRKKSGKLSPYVFPSEGGGPIQDPRGSWKKACSEAGLGDRLFHDFRRTAVRNMVRAGIPERVAMMISGHQTRSVFERYNIVSDEDLKSAASRQELYLSGQKKEMVTKTVTIGKFGKSKKSAN